MESITYVLIFIWVHTRMDFEAPETFGTPFRYTADSCQQWKIRMERFRDRGVVYLKGDNK